MNRSKIVLVFSTILFAAVAGCSNPAGEEATASPTVTMDPTPTASEPEPTPDSTTGDAPADNAPVDNGLVDEAPAADSRPLTVTLDGQPQEFGPTDVYCKIDGGELQHLIAKTNQRPPLLELTPGEFAMLKLTTKGAPEKTAKPSGVTIAGDTVTFDSAQIGAATLTGALTCTSTDGQ